MLTMSSSHPNTERRAMCHHDPHCPPAEAVDREAAHVVAPHPEQGWSLLCNGVVLFEDTGALLPNGQSIPPAGPVGLSPGEARDGTGAAHPGRRRRVRVIASGAYRGR